ncbi:MAG TPA: GNAT family N-acetyltransferase [Rickettsiales bacterium]|nr:GNAT family N-acetyltransferase [Rickettsiales bacterium]
MYNKLKSIIPHKIKIDNFTARLLEKNQDLDLVQKFLEHNEDYFKITTGKGVSEFEGGLLFDVLPPNKTIDDKFIIGLFDNNVLVGLVDLVQNYTEENQWIIGEFILDINYRHKSIGNKLLQNIEELLLNLKVSSLIAVAQENNDVALKFWSENHFKEIKKDKIDIVMFKKLERKEPSIQDKFFKNGKLVSFPSRPTEQQELYKVMQTWFEKDKKYTELQVNEIIKSKIECRDHVTLRRDLVDNHLLNRSNDGKEYFI